MHSIIISIPKSGTNLIASYLKASGRKKAAFLGGKPSKVMGFFSIRGLPSVQLGMEQPMKVNKFILNRFIKFTSKRGNFCTTHTRFSLELRDLFERHFDHIVIAVRNPLDCFDSWLRYTSHNIDFQSDKKLFDQIADSYFFGGNLGKYKFLKISERYNSIIRWKDSHKTIFIDYDRAISEEKYLQDCLLSAKVVPQEKGSYYGNSKTFRLGGRQAWLNNPLLYGWATANYEKLIEQFNEIKYQPYQNLSIK